MVLVSVMAFSASTPSQIHGIGCCLRLCTQMLSQLQAALSRAGINHSGGREAGWDQRRAQEAVERSCVTLACVCRGATQSIPTSGYSSERGITKPVGMAGAAGPRVRVAPRNHPFYSA